MRAIDVHAHVCTEEGNRSLTLWNEAFEKHYKMKSLAPKTEEEMANDFIKADVKGILMAWDAETATTMPRTSNEYVAGVVKRHPDAFIGGFACVDPWKGNMAIQEADKAIKEYGLMGLKFQQAAQGFKPNDHRFYPLWEKCVELKVPVQFHTGVTGLGSGSPGGTGIHLSYCQPMLIDDVAADFPDLTIIGCHVSWPWQEEMLAVLQHKGNVFLEISGWSPRYFPPSLVKEMGGRLQNKVMFGTDYPGFMHDKHIAELEQLGFKPEVMDKILLKNAQRILKLG